MKAKAILLAVLWMGTVAPQAAFAWGNRGHYVVAQIASQRLGEISASARSRLDDVLTHLKWDDLIPSQKKQADDTFALFAADPAIARLMVATTLPDRIRASNRARHVDDPRDGWHFVDWPINAGFTGPDPTGETALTAIAGLVPKLKAGEGTPEEQAINLSFLIHVVGDLHQPLHCSTRYTDAIQFPGGMTTDEKHGDRGGNEFPITKVKNPVDGRKIDNLHAYWDLLPDLNAPKLTIPELASGITSQWPPSKLTADLAETDVEAWSKSGRDDAAAKVYTKKILKTGDTSSYGTSAWKLAKKRLALAGYRLADKLKEIYGS
jgi:hypothetical protein